MFNFRRPNYRPKVNPDYRQLLKPLGEKKEPRLVAQYFMGEGSGTAPVPSPSPTPTASVTPTPTVTPTPSATPAVQYFILAENSDILQAENGDLLVLEAAP